MDYENIGLKAKEKKPHKRTPRNRPKGPPEGDSKANASHQKKMLRTKSLAESNSEKPCDSEAFVSGSLLDDENLGDLSLP